jgi:hypothetical protein
MKPKLKKYSFHQIIKSKAKKSKYTIIVSPDIFDTIKKTGIIRKTLKRFNIRIDSDKPDLVVHPPEYPHGINGNAKIRIIDSKVFYQII